MAYTHKIPATLAGAEMLQEQISKNINIENLAHAFSMTGMSLTEVLDLHDCISSTMMPLRRAYREIEEYSQHFLDQFTTNNNDYYLYAKKCMQELSGSLWAYKKVFFAFLPSHVWRRIKMNKRSRYDLYTNSTIGYGVTHSQDLFIKEYPPEVWDLLALIRVFFSTFRNCATTIDKTLAELERRKKDVGLLTKLMIQYRENTITNFEQIAAITGYTPDIKKSISNPLFLQSRELPTDEDKAVAWYHNCLELDLDNYFIYEHYHGEEMSATLPMNYIMDNLYTHFGKKVQLSVLIAELFEDSRRSNLKEFWSDFAECYQEKYNKKCVTYGGVDKHRNKEKRKPKYKTKIEELKTRHIQSKQKNSSTSKSKVPSYTSISSSL